MIAVFPAAAGVALVVLGAAIRALDSRAAAVPKLIVGRLLWGGGGLPTDTEVASWRRTGTNLVLVGLLVAGIGIVGPSVDLGGGQPPPERADSPPGGPLLSFVAGGIVGVAFGVLSLLRPQMIASYTLRVDARRETKERPEPAGWYVWLVRLLGLPTVLIGLGMTVVGLVPEVFLAL